MSLTFRILSSILLLVQLALLPLVSAQETMGTSSIVIPDSEVCTLPWADYTEFTGYRLAYQTAIVDNELVFAEDLFASMQDILSENCDSIASIIQVQAAPLDTMCNNLLNHLLAKNKYYVTQLDTDSAVATQGLINTVLQTQDCQSILSPDSEFAIELIQQDIQANYNIDVDAMVIPWESNVCFMQYGPAHSFLEQVERIQDPSIATSVLDMVNLYVNQLTSSAVDVIQQQREGTLLKFAQSVLGFRKDSLQNLQYRDHVLPFQIDELMGVASSILESNGISQIVQLIGVHAPHLEAYIGSLITQAYRQDFDGDAQSILASFDQTPITLLWNHQTQSLELQPGDVGMTIVIPATGDQAQLQIRLVKLEGIRWDKQIDDGNGGYYVEKELSPTRIIGDVWSDNTKLLAIDRQANYDQNNDITGGEVALHIAPYIYTNTFTRNYNQQEAGHNQQLTFDVRVFGPAACDMQVLFNFNETYDYSNEDRQDDVQLEVSLNNTRVLFHINNMGDMFDDIDSYRATMPTATSAPTTQNHIIQADIYHKGVRRAYLYPFNNSWLIGFTSQQEPRWFFPVYRDPAFATHTFPLDSFFLLQQIISQFNGSDDGGDEDQYDNDTTQPDNGDNQSDNGDDQSGTGEIIQDILGCTDPAASNYDASATSDDGSCSYPAAGPIVGCPDPYAANYTTGADENDEFNRSMCTW